MTVAYRRTSIGGRRVREEWSEQSAANAELTVTTDPAVSTSARDQPRELKEVRVNYDAAVTATVTATINSALGSAYDVTIADLSLSSQQHATYFPNKPTTLREGDTVDVVAAAVSGQKSSIVIVTELDEV